jgi:hypothetical protein
MNDLVQRTKKGIKRIINKVLDYICPYVPGGCLIPYGFSYLSDGAIVFRLPLPFRWRDYSVCRNEEVWGNANLYVSKHHGYQIFWVEDSYEYER